MVNSNFLITFVGGRFRLITHFLFKNIFKILISMIYNEKIQTLLESLDGKLRILQNGITGAQQISPSEAHTTLEDARKIVDRIAELTRINR